MKLTTDVHAAGRAAGAWSVVAQRSVGAPLVCDTVQYTVGILLSLTVAPPLSCCFSLS